jgi:hypothetical protein
MRGEGGDATSQLMSPAVHRSPNKRWRSNPIFNLRSKPFHFPSRAIRQLRHNRLSPLLTAAAHTAATAAAHTAVTAAAHTAATAAALTAVTAAAHTAATVSVELEIALQPTFHHRPHRTSTATSDVSSETFVSCSKNMSQLVSIEMPPPPPPPLADINSAGRTESAQGTIGKGLAASMAHTAESGVHPATQSDGLSFSLEGEASEIVEDTEGGRLDSLSIQEFVAQYNFNTEGLEGVVFELEEAGGKLDQVICFEFFN